MRRVVDVAAVVVASVLLGLIVIYRMDDGMQEKRVERTVASLREFSQVLGLKSATKDVDLNTEGWPVTIDPEWFKGNPPQNPLVSSSRPWVEIASVDQADLLHPEVRLAVHDGLASFWYNPYQGIVRARVPVTVSDEHALALYNRVNRSQLRSIFADGGSMPRIEPEIHVPEEFGEHDLDPTRPRPNAG